VPKMAMPGAFPPWEGRETPIGSRVKERFSEER
jgi:hypothetical protein